MLHASSTKALACLPLLSDHTDKEGEIEREREERERGRWREMYPIDVQGIEGNPCTVALPVALALVVAARVEQIKVPL